MNQAEYVVHMLVVVPPEYVNISIRHVGRRPFMDETPALYNLDLVYIGCRVDLVYIGCRPCRMCRVAAWLLRWGGRGISARSSQAQWCTGWGNGI